MALQSTTTKGLSLLEEVLWMYLAMTSFPVPVSPLRRTFMSVLATLSTVSMTPLRAGFLVSRTTSWSFSKSMLLRALFSSSSLFSFRALSMLTSSMSKLKGFWMKSVAPLLIASTAVLTSP